MNREQEIKSIKNEQRKLADRLEALEQEERKLEPKRGQVYRYAGKFWIVDSDMHMVSTKGWRSEETCQGGALTHDDEFVAETFDEVFIEREKVREVAQSVLENDDAWQGRYNNTLYSEAAYAEREKLKELL